MTQKKQPQYSISTLFFDKEAGGSIELFFEPNKEQFEVKSGYNFNRETAEHIFDITIQDLQANALRFQKLNLAVISVAMIDVETKKPVEVFLFEGKFALKKDGRLTDLKQAQEQTERRHKQEQPHFIENRTENYFDLFLKGVQEYKELEIDDRGNYTLMLTTLDVEKEEVHTNYLFMEENEENIAIGFKSTISITIPLKDARVFFDDTIESIEKGIKTNKPKHPHQNISLIIIDFKNETIVEAYDFNAGQEWLKNNREVLESTFENIDYEDIRAGTLVRRLKNINKETIPIKNKHK